MRCTLNHTKAKYGIPIFVTRLGRVLSDHEGLATVLKLTDMTSADLAAKCNVSVKTVSGWRSGKTIPVATLNVCGQILTRWRYNNRPKKEVDFADSYV